ncbi:MAG: aminotransferase class V-fold PLP-dependent enzyme [Eubacterium sp.]|nr:aminotransferase class V-fold PLP-dependent enzyme [Eubacterium sp.]
MKARKMITALLLFAMTISVTGYAPEASAAKTTAIDPFYKTLELMYNPHGSSTYMSPSHMGVETLLVNKKKNAAYTAVTKNKKIAKVVKNVGNSDVNDDSKKLIAATGTGTTKAIIYEKEKNKTKKKLGTIKIRVKKMSMGDVVSNTCFGYTSSIDPNVYLLPYMGKTTYDLGSDIQNRMLNDDDRGIHFKKSDYKATYDITVPDDDVSSGQAVDLTKSGVITSKQPGYEFVNFELKFTDGSTANWNITVYVNESSIDKEGKYNLGNIRDHIAGLDTKVKLEDGTEDVLTGFDNASTTPALKPVEEAIAKELEMYGSIGRGYSQKSNHSTDLYNSTRSKVLDFLGADPGLYTCFYTNSTTDGLNKLASALITSKNDLVLATRIEHHANDLSWRERCKMLYAEVDKKGRVKYGDLEKLLKKNKGKIKLVTITAASNVTGYVTDVHRVAKLAHKYGAMIVVDGAQIVSHRAFSMMGDMNDPDDDIDFFAFSAHKMYSPYGGGAVVGLAKELYKHMPTFYGGGTVQIVSDTWVDYKENDIAVYEAGSPNYPGVVGLGKAIDILSDVGFDNIEAHEKKLVRKLIDGLKKLPNVIIYGDTENIDDKVGVVTFNFSDINTQLLAEELSKLGAIATRRGAFCAHPYVWRLMGIPDTELKSFEGCADAKTPGMVRVSFGIYNTEEEVDKFLSVMPKAMEAAKKKSENLDVVPEY